MPQDILRLDIDTQDPHPQPQRKLRNRSPVKTSIIIPSNEQISTNVSSGRKRFIKLYGRGPQNSDEVQSGVILQPRSSNHLPEILDPDDLIDVIDGKETEEPFTLEPFDELIQMHLDSQKDFILARVTTVDPNDENRMYYSYYAGHHINKILFRTQPEQGLLHRMRAKNPLNNMTIVGDVHYYNIKYTAPKSSEISGNQKTSPERIFDFFTKSGKPPSPDSVSQVSILIPVSPIAPSISKLLGMEPSKKTLHLYMKPEAFESSGSPLSSKKDLSKNGVQTRASSRRNSADDAFSETQTPRMTSKFIISTNETDDKLNNDLSQAIEEQSFRKIRSISYHNYRQGAEDINQWIFAHEQSRIIELYATKTRSKTKRNTQKIPLSPSSKYYTAKYFASDDDYLMQSSIRTYFKENALESTDTVLFTIPTSSNEARLLNQDITFQHPALRNFVFSYQDSNGQIRGITVNRFRWMILIGLLAILIISRFYIESTIGFLGLLAAFLLISLALFIFI